MNGFNEILFSWLSGDGSPYMVPVDIWVRVPMTSPTQKACFKICKCSNKGMTSCQPLPCVSLENCRLHDKVVQNGKYLLLSTLLVP